MLADPVHLYAMRYAQCFGGDHAKIYIFFAYGDVDLWSTKVRMSDSWGIRIETSSTCAYAATHFKHFNDPKTPH